MTNWLNEWLFCSQARFAWHAYLSAASSSLKTLSIFSSIVAQTDTLHLPHALCVSQLHVVKELTHKQMDWYKHCSSFSWFCSSLCSGYQIRNSIQALIHKQRSLAHTPKSTPFYHMHIVQEKLWVSMQCTTYRTVSWVCFRLGLMHTLQPMSPEIISHILKKGSLAKVQPPHRAAITLLRQKLFPKPQWNRRGDSPQIHSIIKI